MNNAEDLIKRVVGSGWEYYALGDKGLAERKVVVGQ